MSNQPTYDWVKSVSLMGSISEDLFIWPYVIMGHYDRDLLIGFFYVGHSRVPHNDEELFADESSQRGLDNIKNLLRDAVKRGLELENEKIQAEKQRELEALAEQARQSFRSMSKPAPEGTVKELAARYGVSISHVRKLKGEGRLHELVGTSGETQQG